MKIGSYSIPDLRLFPNIYDDVKKIYKEYKLDEVENDTAVATLCGHKSAKSGAWFSKLADMRLYGLLESRGIKLTTLAQKLTYGTEEDVEDATRNAIFNVPLWKELYSNFGAKLPSENFWVQIQRITGVDPLEAQKHADSIRKAYLDDVRHIKPEKEEIEGGDEMGTDKIDTNITIPVELEEFRFGDIRIWLPKENTQEAWNKTKKMLDIYLEMKEEG